MNDFIKSILMGIVEGLTEFIPVSSTGHLIIAGQALKFTSEFAKTFDVAMQLGAILAVIIVFRKKFIQLADMKQISLVFPDGIHIILTTFPALIFGYLLHSIIKNKLFNPMTVAIGLIAGSFLMIAADYYSKYNKNPCSKLTYKKSFLVGLFQVLAMWPGVSRSGATISGSVFMGLDHKESSAYSFICAVPVMFCATAYDLFKTSAVVDLHNLLILAIGFCTSMIFGWISIVFFLKLISRFKLLPFVFYRIILAVVILFFMWNKPINAEIALIKSNIEIKNIPNEVEVIKTYLTSTEQKLFLTRYKNKDSLKKFNTQTSTQTSTQTNAQAGTQANDISILDLSPMYIQIKELQPFLFLKNGERKKTLTEIILGGEKSYDTIQASIDSKTNCIDFLHKAGINMETPKRIYLELVMDNRSQKKSTTLWSYEYDTETKKIREIRTPEQLWYE